MMRLLALLLLFSVIDVRAQHTHRAPPPVSLEEPAVSAFISAARAATEPYHSIDAAVAAGYRLMGPDMPNMGEHWIHPGRAVQRTFDPEQPAVLTYLIIDGAPVLTGVAYAIPVRPGEAAPQSPIDGAMWHFHSADLNKEAFGPADPSTMHSDAPVESYRLAMLHAWIWLDNPDGLFAADNWALPYVRVGLPVPEVPNPRAARSVFLLSEGVDYYTEAIRHMAGADAATLVAVRAVLTTYAQRAQAVVAADGNDPERLGALWVELWDELGALLPADRRASIAHFAE